MVAIKYSAVTTETFTGHTNPGLLPSMQAGATQYQIVHAKEQHKKKLELFKEQRFVERALKSQIINTFKETYLLDIKEDHIRYNNVSISNIFQHLHRNYGKITNADLLANKEVMSKP